MAADKNAKPTADAGDASPKSSKMLIIAFVGVIVMIETCMFFFLVPSAEEVSALAEQKLIDSVEKGEEEAEKQALDENKIEEYELGQFGETFSPNKTEASYRVELTLYGLIRKKNREKMTKEIAEKNGRLRHAIRTKIRNSDIEELQENQLGLLERRILTTSNHLLDEDLLLGVGFNDYQLIEQ